LAIVVVDFPRYPSQGTQAIEILSQTLTFTDQIIEAQTR
jgi:hypothetical protein